jgi:hypothetical protein
VQWYREIAHGAIAGSLGLGAFTRWCRVGMRCGAQAPSGDASCGGLSAVTLGGSQVSGGFRQRGQPEHEPEL